MHDEFGFDGDPLHMLRREEEATLADAPRVRGATNGPWASYQVGTPSDRDGWVNDDCVPLTSLSHVAHLRTARRILEDERVRARLVTDESVLRSERIRVTWLSPNYWMPGFRYGNVRFEYDWETLSRGKQAYWVEVMTTYSPHAPRILLSDRDESHWLTPYDPAVGDGPWWHDTENDRHYWNGNYTLEVMVRSDLSLRDCLSVDLVKHHPQLCSVDRTSCPDMGLRAWEAQPELLAMLVAEGLGANLPGWVQQEDGNRTPGTALAVALSRLLDVVVEDVETYDGLVGATNYRARPLSLAVLDALAARDADSRRALIGMFGSEQDARVAIQSAVANHFEVPAERWPGD